MAVVGPPLGEDDPGVTVLVGEQKREHGRRTRRRRGPEAWPKPPVGEDGHQLGRAVRKRRRGGQPGEPGRGVLEPHGSGVPRAGDRGPTRRDTALS